MDRVFNRGVGMALVVRAADAADALEALAAAGHPVDGHRPGGVP